MRRFSPYNFAFDNPIRFVDPDGMSADDIVVINTSGKVIQRTVSTTNEVYLARGSGSTYAESAVSVSLSYTGNMSSDNAKMSVGTLQINATDKETGQATSLSTYNADSGPSKQGSIPNGDYTASKIEHTDEEGMVRNGVGFKVTLSDNKEDCRDHLRIHPDGEEHVGTAGCIGLVETKENLQDFQSKMGALLQDGTKVNVNVNINNNPNFSDCDSKGNKIHKGHTAAGN